MSLILSVQVELASKFYPFISSTAAASIDHNLCSYVHIVLVCLLLDGTQRNRCIQSNLIRTLYFFCCDLYFDRTINFMTWFDFCIDLTLVLLYWPTWCRPIWVKNLSVVDFCDSNSLILQTCSYSIIVYTNGTPNQLALFLMGANGVCQIVVPPSSFLLPAVQGLTLV